MSRKAISAALLALTPIAPVFACSSAPPSDASSVAAPASADFAPGPLPRDWIASGGDREAYALGTDPAMRRDERAALTLQSKRATPSFGTVMTMADAASYRGKRVRLRGAMRSDDVRGKGGLWMRVDGPEGTSSLAFDNMFDRPVCGTTEWHTYDVVLDVSPDAQKIAYGVLLQGEGRLWADSLALEAVGTDVATTDLARPTVRGAGGIGASPAWFGAGSAPRKYEMSADANVRRGEGASITLRAKGSPQGDDFGTLMQDMDARSFRGKRAHFSAFVRARDVGDWAGIWMRVDDAKGKTLAFDNMEDRPIKGTSEWRRY